MIGKSRKWSIALLVIITGFAISLPFILNMARAANVTESVVDDMKFVYTNLGSDPRLGVLPVIKDTQYGVKDARDYYAMIKWSQKTGEKIVDGDHVEFQMEGIYTAPSATPHDIIAVDENGQSLGKIGEVTATDKNSFKAVFTDVNRLNAEKLSGSFYVHVNFDYNELVNDVNPNMARFDKQVSIIAKQENSDKKYTETMSVPNTIPKQEQFFRRPVDGVLTTNVGNIVPGESIEVVVFETPYDGLTLVVGAAVPYKGLYSGFHFEFNDYAMHFMTRSYDQGLTITPMPMTVEGRDVTNTTFRRESTTERYPSNWQKQDGNREKLERMSEWVLEVHEEIRFTERTEFSFWTYYDGRYICTDFMNEPNYRFRQVVSFTGEYLTEFKDLVYTDAKVEAAPNVVVDVRLDFVDEADPTNILHTRTINNVSINETKYNGTTYMVELTDKNVLDGLKYTAISSQGPNALQSGVVNVVTIICRKDAVSQYAAVSARFFDTAGNKITSGPLADDMVINQSAQIGSTAYRGNSFALPLTVTQAITNAGYVYDRHRGFDEVDQNPALNIVNVFVGLPAQTANVTMEFINEDTGVTMFTETESNVPLTETKYNGATYEPTTEQRNRIAAENAEFVRSEGPMALVAGNNVVKVFCKTKAVTTTEVVLQFIDEANPNNPFNTRRISDVDLSETKYNGSGYQPEAEDQIIIDTANLVFNRSEGPQVLVAGTNIVRIICAAPAPTTTTVVLEFVEEGSQNPPFYTDTLTNVPMNETKYLDGNYRPTTAEEAIIDAANLVFKRSEGPQVLVAGTNTVRVVCEPKSPTTTEVVLQFIDEANPSAPFNTRTIPNVPLNETIYNDSNYQPVAEDQAIITAANLVFDRAEGPASLQAGSNIVRIICKAQPAQTATVDIIYWLFDSNGQNPVEMFRDQETNVPLTETKYNEANFRPDANRLTDISNQNAEFVRSEGPASLQPGVNTVNIACRPKTADIVLRFIDSDNPSNPPIFTENISGVGLTETQYLNTDYRPTQPQTDRLNTEGFVFERSQGPASLDPDAPNIVDVYCKKSTSDVYVKFVYEDNGVEREVPNMGKVILDNNVPVGSNQYDNFNLPNHPKYPGFAADLLDNNFEYVSTGPGIPSVNANSDDNIIKVITRPIPVITEAPVYLSFVYTENGVERAVPGMDKVLLLNNATVGSTDYANFNLPGHPNYPAYVAELVSKQFEYVGLGQGLPSVTTNGDNNIVKINVRPVVVVTTNVYLSFVYSDNGILRTVSGMEKMSFDTQAVVGSTTYANFNLAQQPTFSTYTGLLSARGYEYASSGNLPVVDANDDNNIIQILVTPISVAKAPVYIDFVYIDTNGNEVSVPNMPRVELTDDATVGDTSYSNYEFNTHPNYPNYETELDTEGYVYDRTIGLPTVTPNGDNNIIKVVTKPKAIAGDQTVKLEIVYEDENGNLVRVPGFPNDIILSSTAEEGSTDYNDYKLENDNDNKHIISDLPNINFEYVETKPLPVVSDDDSKNVIYIVTKRVESSVTIKFVYRDANGNDVQAINDKVIPNVYVGSTAYANYVVPAEYRNELLASNFEYVGVRNGLTSVSKNPADNVIIVECQQIQAFEVLLEFYYFENGNRRVLRSIPLGNYPEGSTAFVGYTIPQSLLDSAMAEGYRFMSITHHVNSVSQYDRVIRAQFEKVANKIPVTIEFYYTDLNGNTTMVHFDNLAHVDPGNTDYAEGTYTITSDLQNTLRGLKYKYNSITKYIPSVSDSDNVVRVKVDRIVEIFVDIYTEDNNGNPVLEERIPIGESIVGSDEYKDYVLPQDIIDYLEQQGYDIDTITRLPIVTETDDAIKVEVSKRPNTIEVKAEFYYRDANGQEVTFHTASIGSVPVGTTTFAQGYSLPTHLIPIVRGHGFEFVEITRYIQSVSATDNVIRARCERIVVTGEVYIELRTQSGLVLVNEHLGTATVGSTEYANYALTPALIAELQTLNHEFVAFTNTVDVVAAGNNVIIGICRPISITTTTTTQGTTTQTTSATTPTTTITTVSSVPTTTTTPTGGTTTTTTNTGTTTTNTGTTTTNTGTTTTNTGTTTTNTGTTTTNTGTTNTGTTTTNTGTTTTTTNTGTTTTNTGTTTTTTNTGTTTVTTSVPTTTATTSNGGGGGYVTPRTTITTRSSVPTTATTTTTRSSAPTSTSTVNATTPTTSATRTVSPTIVWPTVTTATATVQTVAPTATRTTTGVVNTTNTNTQGGGVGSGSGSNNGTGTGSGTGSGGGVGNSEKENPVTMDVVKDVAIKVSILAIAAGAVILISSGTRDIRNKRRK